MREFTRRQNEIIEIAAHIILEEGIQNLTMKNISSNLGVSEPALYRHFKNKQDILLATIEKVEVLFTFPEYLNGSSIDKMTSFVISIYDKFEIDPEISKIIISDVIFSDNKELQRKLNKTMSTTRDHLRKIITEGQENGELKNNLPSKSICRIVLGSMRLLIIQWYYSKQRYNLKKKGIEIWKEIKTLIAN